PCRAPVRIKCRMRMTKVAGRRNFAVRGCLMKECEFGPVPLTDESIAGSPLRSSMYNDPTSEA
ncbi:MAG: hypothetical protein WCK86_20885, partial [Planctomycetia bacterium]